MGGSGCVAFRPFFLPSSLDRIYTLFFPGVAGRGCGRRCPLYRRCALRREGEQMPEPTWPSKVVGISGAK